VNTPDKSLKRALVERSAQREADGDHPEIADLAAYLDDMLSPDEEEAIREHLSFCRRCNDEVTALEAPLGFEVDASAALPMATQKPAGTVVVWLRNPSWLALAAAVFIAGLLVGHWMSNGQAAANQLPIELRPGQSATRGSVAIAIPALVERLGFNLNIDLPKDYAAYVLVVTDENGNRILRLDRLRPLPGGYFNVSLPAAWFSSGLYTFQLNGIPESGRQERLATYTINLTRD